MKPGDRVVTPDGKGVITRRVIHLNRSFQYEVNVDNKFQYLNTYGLYWPHEIKTIKK